MKTKRNFNAVPAEAFTFHADAKLLSDKGDTKTVKVELLARTGQPIEHWYWGRIIHDLKGMTHKNRMPVDYAHNDGEVLGYVNKFKISSGDLILNGVLTPFKDDDRASEVIHKARAGVPYQASIFFGGDDDQYEQVPEGATAKVNGFEFTGPGIIARKWRLNGVAICPYGADGNTETNIFAKQGGTRKIVLRQAKEGGEKMNITAFKGKAKAFIAKAKAFGAELKTKLADGADEETAEEIKVIAEDVAEAVEKIEEIISELEEAVDDLEEAAVEIEGEDTDKKDEESEEKEEELVAKRKEFSRIKAEFGAEIAAQIFERGEGYSDALKLAYGQQKKQIAELKQRVAESKKNTGGSAAKFSGDVERKPVDAWKAAQKKN